MATPTKQAAAAADGTPGLNDQIDTAARGGGVDGLAEDALLAYFLGNAPAPNSGVTADFDVDLGEGRTWHCTLKPITWTAYKDAQSKAIGTDGDFDIYMQASYVVAQATVTPLLGKMLQRIRDFDEENAPPDGAALLRRAFQQQAGALIYLHRRVVEMSRLDEAGSGGVKEVEAGKP